MKQKPWKSDLVALLTKYSDKAGHASKHLFCLHEQTCFDLPGNILLPASVLKFFYTNVTKLPNQKKPTTTDQTQHLYKKTGEN